MNLLSRLLKGIGGFILLMGCFSAESIDKRSKGDSPDISLPLPGHDGTVSVERALFNRMSIRTFSDVSLSLREAGQLLWAGGGANVDGLTGATRTFPSAGGLYPVELYLVAEKIDSLAPGIYHYIWKNHSLRQVKKGVFIDSIKTLTYSGAFRNAAVPACIVAAAVYSRTTSKYGERGGSRYVPMDIGGCGENIFLQAVALGLGTFIIGAFDDDSVRRVIGAPREETPLYIMPVGRR
ncbi:MAG: SagB/ThcOx family dehydrogenase [Chitinispirillaceae bacterium]|nr:SagB/ThcOx family dehydrogenase [Chitinispirillaceae bacterium]